MVEIHSQRYSLTLWKPDHLKSDLQNVQINCLSITFPPFDMKPISKQLQFNKQFLLSFLEFKLLWESENWISKNQIHTKILQEIDKFSVNMKFPKLEQNVWILDGI